MFADATARPPAERVEPGTGAREPRGADRAGPPLSRAAMLPRAALGTSRTWRARAALGASRTGEHACRARHRPHWRAHAPRSEPARDGGLVPHSPTGAAAEIVCEPVMSSMSNHLDVLTCKLPQARARHYLQVHDSPCRPGPRARPPQAKAAVARVVSLTSRVSVRRRLRLVCRGSCSKQIAAM